MMNHNRLFAKITLIGLALIIVLSAVPALAAPASKVAIKITPASHQKYVQASVVTQAPVKRVQMHIDGERVNPNVQWKNQRHLTVRYALKNVAPGNHTARLTVWDQQNRSVRQQWSFQKGAPAVTADKTSIKSGESVRLTGQGFTPGFRLSVSMGGVNTDASGNYGSVIVDQAGRFSMDVTLAKYPDGSALQPGAIVLLVHTTQFKEKAPVQLQVLANPAVSASKTSITPGESLTLTGQGFTPGANLIIGMGGVNTGAGGNYGTATVDGSGRFTLDVTLAKYPDGSPLHADTIVVLAHNADGSEKAGAHLQVLANPTLTADKTSIKPGDRVTLTGKGFTPGVALTVSLGDINTGASGTYGTAIADSSGNFSLAVSLATFPDGSALRPGAIVLLVHNADGSEKATAQLQVLPNPALVASASTIRPSDQVMLTGTGFTPGTAITIRLGGVNTGASGNYGTTVANNLGGFALPVTLARYPDGSVLQPGTIVLVAHNAGGQENATVQLQVIAAPSLTVDRTVIQPGDRIVLTGQGFAAGTLVSISLGRPNSGAGGNYGSAIADASGRVIIPVTLTRFPDGSLLTAGTIVLLARDASGNQRAIVQLTIQELTAGAPTGLQITSLTKGATSAEPTTVGLRWQDNASNEWGFRIRAIFTRMNGGTDTQMWQIGPNSNTAHLSFVAGGINPVTRACFTVTAYNAQGESSPSNTGCIQL